MKAFTPLGAALLLLLLALPLPAAQAAQEEDAQEILHLTLRGNPSTGYAWQWRARGSGAVKETGVDYAQDNPMPGSPATFTYNFAGEKEGEVELRFVYSQSEKGRPGDRVNVYRLKVLADKRIVLLDMKEDIVGKPRPTW